jgi:DNA-binding transcriptional MerR regulator
MQSSPTWAEKGRADEYVRRVAAADADAQYPFHLPRKLYRVSEIADHLGLTRQTIHNYATAGLIAEESQTPGGQRLFGESVFADIILIQRLKATHRLTEIRRILADRIPLDAAAPQTSAESSTPTSTARNLERSLELAALAHRDEPQADAALPTIGAPADTRTGGLTARGTRADAAPVAAEESGPDFAVRASSQLPLGRPGDPGSPDHRHVRETSEDDRERG